jgi:hypothetical protein
VAAARLDLDTGLVKPDNPEVRLLEHVHGLGKVPASDVQMLTGTGRGVDSGRGHFDGAGERQNHAVHADRLRSTQQGPEVLRIVERIKEENEGGLPVRPRVLKDIEHVAVWISTDLGDDTLMVTVNLIQPRAGKALNGYTQLLCQGKDVREAALHLSAFGNLDAKDVAAAGAESLIDGIAGIEEFLHDPPL